MRIADPPQKKKKKKMIIIKGKRGKHSLFHLLDSREVKASSLRMFSVEAVSLWLILPVPANGTRNLLTQSKYRQVSG